MMMMMMMMFSLTHGPGEDAITTVSEDQPYKQGWDPRWGQFQGNQQ